MNTTMRENLGLLIMSCLLLLVLSMGQAVAGIRCETMHGEKSFTINADNVAFEKSEQGRSISSVVPASNNAIYHGIKKVLYENGNKITIHIEDIKNFSDANDYMTVADQKGHKITYPLTCL